MRKHTTIKAGLALCAFLSTPALQAMGPVQSVTSQSQDSMPVYRVAVVARIAKAINYQHRSGATKIDFRGTDLLPKSHGEAKVESKQGYMEIEVEFDELQPASKFGAEYLTYVLWAITPEGRTANLGEILLNGTESKLNVTTELQVFGLVVTAEPYFSVTMPSDLVVMENVVRTDTVGKVEEIVAKYDLLQRGQYERLANPLELKLDAKMPLELYEARNAVQIARATGAAKYAAEAFLKAENSLKQAEAYQARNAGRKPVTMTAREAVQVAEDARAIAVQRQEEERLTNERVAGLEREAQAKAETEAEARLRAQAEADQKLEADRRVRAEAERAAAQSETEKTKQAAESARVAAQTEADRVKRESDAAKAAAAAQAENAARAAAQAATAAAQAATDGARLAAEEAERLQKKSESEKADLRAQILSQFKSVLETRDTARGLVVNMSDVLFDTAKFTLRTEARERLAKVAGIILGHPGLKLEVEGHTDSVGSEEYNQRLSEQRAGSVHSYLTQQGVAGMSSDASKGFGKTRPVDSNETAAGRQRNRRVELVVSGEVIGTQIGTADAAK